MNQDTIAAISTAMSNSGIGIVRISGSDAITIADRIYRSTNSNKKLINVDSHTIHYGHIYDGDDVIDIDPHELCGSAVLGNGDHRTPSFCHFYKQRKNNHKDSADNQRHYRRYSYHRISNLNVTHIYDGNGL